LPVLKAKNIALIGADVEDGATASPSNVQM